MKMKKIVFSALILALSATTATAQKQWSLTDCINHAVENNIDIQKNALYTKQNEISLNSAKNDRLPSLNGSMGGSLYFGRGPSRDGTYTDNSQHTSNAGLSLGGSIYEGSRLKNNILSRQFDLQASIADYEGAKEDLSLQIVSMYMQILYNKELYAVSQKQVELSAGFSERSKILLDAGRASEGDYFESLSILSRDKLSMTETAAQLQLSLLTLSQALNLDSVDGFDISTPVFDDPNSDITAELSNTNEVYDIAVENRPQVKGAELKLSSLEYQLKVARASGLPSLSYSAGYNNSYYYSFTSDVENYKFTEQMRRNGSQTIGLSLQIPIFNKFATRNQRKSAELNIISQNLEIRNVKLKLLKDIEQAYQNAKLSKEKFSASQESLTSSKIAFEYARVKADEGRATIFDFNDSKTSLIRSESELIRAKYEFLFNKKILDFYSGVPLAR